jgi:hypothetical protein
VLRMIVVLLTPSYLQGLGLGKRGFANRGVFQERNPPRGWRGVGAAVIDFIIISSGFLCLPPLHSFPATVTVRVQDCVHIMQTTYINTKLML